MRLVQVSKFYRCYFSQNAKIFRSGFVQDAQNHRMLTKYTWIAGQSIKQPQNICIDIFSLLRLLCFRHHFWHRFATAYSASPPKKTGFQSYQSSMTTIEVNRTGIYSALNNTINVRLAFPCVSETFSVRKPTRDIIACGFICSARMSRTM